MNDFRVDLRALLGADTGEVIEFERAVAKLGLAGLEQPDSLKVSGRVEQAGANWLVTGGAEVTVTLQCARCLQEFRHTVTADFSEEFSRKPEEDQFMADETRLDLKEMLRSVLVLAVPEPALHDPDCKGLCAVCGKDLNEEPHTHPKPRRDKENPFSALKRKKR